MTVEFIASKIFIYGIGKVKISENQVLTANRIFETLLYNLFLAVWAMQQEEIYNAALKERSLFIENGHLNWNKRGPL